MNLFNRPIKPLVDGAKKLHLLSLGGVAVNKNLYVYETDRDIILVDCGVSFPDENMPGIDLIIPDVTYLTSKKEKIRGIFLTHGHEDHCGALPYLLPKLGKIPVFGTKLTLGLAKIRCDEIGLRVNWRETLPRQTVSCGSFQVTFVHVAHSIPDATNLAIRTPVGTIYHASDFKFDWTPVDGKPTDIQTIAAIGREGVLCLLSDCLRVEKPGYTLSEQNIAPTFDYQMKKCLGKFIFTTQSSNISRIQQAVNVTAANNRKIVFAGRSVEQNVRVAARLGFLHLPKSLVVTIDDIKRLPANKLVVIASGALGQDTSALVRIAGGEHKIKIAEGDMVIFSQDPIPGSETNVDALINTLIKAGADVYYSAILDDLHVSGHEAADGLRLMLSLISPKFVIPIGGTIRHLKRYQKLALSMGYNRQSIIIPEDGQIIEFTSQNWTVSGKTDIKNVLIDGLGVGDVGNVVLRDRLTMAADGIVIVLVPIEKTTGETIGDVDIVSRGFVYMKESDTLIGQAKEVVRAALAAHPGAVSDFRFLKRRIADDLEKFLFDATHRRPLILPVIVEV